MSHKTWFRLLSLGCVALLAACYPPQLTPTPGANMPNPASVYCEQNGGRLELRQDAAGGVAGACIFPDGSECDEWAYFRNECKPGAATATVEPAPSATSEAAADGWRLYRNEQLGYSFHTPADATIEIADDPLRTLLIIGPPAKDERWPVIHFSHPADREDYRPPEGVDLERWLIDHQLLMTGSQRPSAEVRQPDRQIAGVTAIHTRFARSPQSYAYDKYFFAKSGQLYVIVILHTGDKEDWTLYNRFLDSIEVQ
jgi:putative hemolysin